MKFKLNNLLWIFFAAVFITSCSKDDVPEVYEVFEDPKTLIDQSFGGDEAQKWIFIFRPGAVKALRK